MFRRNRGRRYLMGAAALGLTLALCAGACSDDTEVQHDGGVDTSVDGTTVEEGVEVVFDPLGTPPLAPFPNDLFVDPATGLVKMPVPDAATNPAGAYLLEYANTLNGFSHVVTPEAELTGALDAASVGNDAIKVLDVTDPSNPVAVDNLTFEYKEISQRHLLRVWNFDGWKRGASYAIVLLSKLKDAQGDPVKRSQTFDQVLGTTAPSDATLERLRAGYDKLLSAASGITRDDVVGIWSFPVVSMNQAAFDVLSKTPLVPIPTDTLRDPTTGMLKIPDGPNDSEAQKEFNVFLNSLDGFPANLPTMFPFYSELDDTTVDKGLLVYELDSSGSTPKLVEVTDASISWDAAKSMVTMTGKTPFKRGTTYVVAAVAGDQALKNKETTLAALPKRSLQMHMALSPEPVCTWDSTQKACTATKVTYFIDDYGAGSAGKLTALERASLVEQLRQAYDPLLKLMVAGGVKREDVVAMTSFTVTSLTELLYDPANGVLPFPNNLLMDQTTGKVDFPPVPGETPTEKALREGLNTLDGFATQGTAFALVDGKVDKASLVPLEGVLAADVSGMPVAVSFDVDDQAGAIVAKPLTPLAEKANYGIVVMSKLKPGDLKPDGGVGVVDDQGRRVIPSIFMALLRSKAPIYDVTTKKSLVNVLDDATAELIEQARAAHEPLFDLLEGLLQVKRQDIACGWTLQTQSITETATKVRTIPWTILKAIDSDQPKFTGALDTTLATFPAALHGNPTIATPVAKGNIGGWVEKGTFTTWIALDQAGTGAMLPDPTQGKAEAVPFMLTIPKGTMPAAGWPLVIYQHGYPSHKVYGLFLADDLAAAGFALLTFDMVYHGDRTWCTEDTHCTASGTCDKATGKCSTSLVLDPVAQDGWPEANAAKFLDMTNPNPFAARDNFRQQLIDTEALFRAIQLGADSGITGGTVKIDPTQVHYLARSMGGIIGTGVMAVTSLPKRVLLNVAGAPVLGAFENGPRWKDLWAGFVAAFGVQPGTPGYLQILYIFYMIMDAVDPGNFGKYLTQLQLDDLVNPTPGSKIPKKEVMFQLSGPLDTYVPNANQVYLSKIIGATTTDTTFPNCSHRFLWLPEPAGTDNDTAAARAQMVNFFKTGTICKPDLTNGTCN